MGITYDINNKQIASIPFKILLFNLLHKQCTSWCYLCRHLYISKLPTRQWTFSYRAGFQTRISKLPTRQWTRIEYTINAVVKKTKRNFTIKNPFFKWFFNILIFNIFILSQKKGLAISRNLSFKNPFLKIFYSVNFGRFVIWWLVLTAITSELRGLACLFFIDDKNIIWLIFLNLFFINSRIVMT